MTTRGRRRLPAERRRFEIVETATRLIAERGYRGLTLKAVADACGMTAPGVMHYFPTTEQLLSAVLDHYTVVLMKRAAMLRDDGAGARATLDEVVREIWRWPVCIRLYLHLSAEAIDRDHVARSYLLARHRRAIEGLVDLIGDQHPDPLWAAELFYSAMDGLRMRWVRDPSTDPIAEWEQFADAAFAGTPLSRTDPGPAASA